MPRPIPERPETLTPKGPGYPSLLAAIHDPPAELHVRGAFLPADELAVAIVGSRKASVYGIVTAERLGRELASAGITVVSGLAIGIDGAAHRGALAAGGRTIAVLGSGLDVLYPSRHTRLADEITRSGAVVSEFRHDTPPRPENFPRRNRIVAGLSRAVVVVEAGEFSGSLITARLAAAEGRDVYAVPGEAALERTRGAHRLLREGAGLCEFASDVLRGTFGLELARAMQTRNRARLGSSGPSPHEEEERRILEGFDKTVMHADELIEKGGLGAARTLEILSTLELSGAVERKGGMLFIRRGEGS